MVTLNSIANKTIHKIHTDIVDTVNEVTVFKNEATDMMKLAQITVPEKDYILGKSKDMITRLENIMTMIEKSFEPTSDESGKIKINFSYYGADVYAKLANVITGHIREIRELSKSMMTLDIINFESRIKAIEENSNENQKIKLSSSDLLKIIKKASENSQLNAVNADFKVINELAKETLNESTYSSKNTD